MSAIAVVVRPDSVVVAADRRTVEFRSWDGTSPRPFPGADNAKVRPSRGGCVLAFAGTAAVVTPTGTLDLRDVALAAADSPDPWTVAGRIADAFDEVAERFRRTAIDPGFSVPEIGPDPIHFGAVVASCDVGQPKAIVVRLPVNGRSYPQDIAPFGGNVLAPASVQASFVAPLEAAQVAATPGEALDLLVAAIGTAARKEPTLISFEQDTCILKASRAPMFASTVSDGGPGFVPLARGGPQ